MKAELKGKYEGNIEEREKRPSHLQNIHSMSERMLREDPQKNKNIQATLKALNVALMYFFFFLKPTLKRGIQKSNNEERKKKHGDNTEGFLIVNMKATISLL